jgi:hypothetical protein
MNKILKKFSLAVEEISSNTKSMQELVYRAYHGHLSDIDPDDLPEEIQAVFEAVSGKLESGLPIKDFGNDEAAYFADDIRYMFDVIRSFNH